MVDEALSQASLKAADMFDTFGHLSVTKEQQIRRAVIARLAREHSVEPAALRAATSLAEAVKSVRLFGGDVLADRLISGSGPLSKADVRQIKRADPDELVGLVESICGPPSGPAFGRSTGSS